jgi:integrase
MRKTYYLHRRGRIWYAEYRDPITGEIKNSQSTKQSNRQAAEKVASREAARLAELSDFPPMSLGEWGGRFFKDGCPHLTRLNIAGKHISDKYINNSRRAWEKYICNDPICAMQLFNLRKSHLLAFRSRLVARIGQRRVAQTVWSTLHVIIHEAFYYGLIDHDPCVGLGQIAYQKKRRVALTAEQVKLLLNPSIWNGSRYYLPTKCAALTGLRRGEVRGLLWEDLYPEKRIIVVRHNIPGDAGVESIKEPKWGKPRITAYPLVLQRDIEPLRATGFVFGYRDLPLGGSRWLKEFKRIADLIGAKGATLHSLRHSLNTLLLNMGESRSLLQASFGWSDNDVQEIYTHTDLYDYRPQSELIDRIFDDDSLEIKGE